MTLTRKKVPVGEVSTVAQFHCPLCLAFAIVELTPAQREQQPDNTTHVCNPALGGCNHGFTTEG